MDQATALHLAESDPRSALPRFFGAIDASGLGADQRAGLLYAAGVAYRTLDQLEDSERCLRQASELANGVGHKSLYGDVLLSLAATRAMAGHIDDALELLAEAEECPEPARTHARTQRAGWMARMGRIGEAVELFAESQDLLEEWNDQRWLGHLHNNRGLLFTYIGEFEPAEQDLRRALDIYTSLGWDVSTAEAEHNLGFLLTRRGDLVEALELFRRAGATLARLGLDPSELPTDEAEALLLAGLPGRAMATAAASVEELKAKAVPAKLAEAQLMYARAASAAGASGQAHRAAVAAAASFSEQDQLAWAARAELLKDQHGPDSGERLRRTAHQLRDGGLAAAAIETMLAAAMAPGGDGGSDLAVARDWMRRLHPAPLPLVIAEARAAALQADASGATASAARAAWRGAVAAERLAAGAPSPEIQASVSSHVAELADVGRRAALGSRSNDRLFRWIEAGRSIALSPPPVVRSKDTATTAAREQVRALRADAAEGADAALASELAAAEREAARVERARPGRVRYPPRASLADYKAALDDQVGLHLFSNSGQIHGLVIRDRARRIPPIDSAGFATYLEDRTLDLVDALATGRTLEHDATDLEIALGADDVVVVCPPRRLFAAPWSAIPPLVGVASVITPSARWYCAAGKGHKGGTASLIVGPGLATGDDEATVVRAAHKTRNDVGRDRDTARRLIATSPLVHIAAHATYRNDNPLFSTIELDDGPLFVYDVSELESVAQTLVISACSAGTSGGVGGGLLGFVGALLGLGASTVIAPVVPVPDEQPTVQLMAALHEHLAGGLQPARALQAARSTVDHPVAHAFQCFGR